MDLTSWLLRRTPPRPLVLTGPGGTGARLAVERVARERGWWPASSPAEANLLVIAGGGDAFEPYVGRVWHLVPAPRVRMDVTDAADVPRTLDAAVVLLHDVDHQRAEAEQHTTNATYEHHEDQADHSGHTDHRQHTSDSNHAGHGEHQAHMGHGGHDHHMAGMELPGGVPMADRAEDRDGLVLDQLHVPLGPALPLWPAGLIVHTRLQGDVIQHASVELLRSHQGSYWPAVHEERRGVTRRLDSSARLLALAGWEDAAVIAQRLRDEVLAGKPVSDRLPRWVRRVRRSRTLRWLLSGVGAVSDGPTALAGDALDRLHRWLDSLTETDAQQLPDPEETQWTVDALPTLLAGTELASARLLIASLDPDLDVLSHHEVHHA